VATATKITTYDGTGAVAEEYTPVSVSPESVTYRDMTDTALPIVKQPALSVSKKVSATGLTKIHVALELPETTIVDGVSTALTVKATADLFLPATSTAGQRLRLISAFTRLIKNDEMSKVTETTSLPY
jgi:hypothetical protein